MLINKNLLTIVFCKSRLERNLKIVCQIPPKKRLCSMSKNKTLYTNSFLLYQPSLSLYELLKNNFNKVWTCLWFCNPYIFETWRCKSFDISNFKKISVSVRMRKMLKFFQHCLYFVIPISLKSEGVILWYFKLKKNFGKCQNAQNVKNFSTLSLFCNPYIFETWRCNPLIFQTLKKSFR